MKKYFSFLGASYTTAFLFELNANLFFDGTLFQAKNWPIFFLIWYGTWYSIFFSLFRKRPLWVPVIAGAILGPIVEVVVFKRLNIIIDPIVYAIMFFVPFWLYQKRIQKTALVE